MTWVEANIKWIMIVSGVLTCTMLFARPGRGKRARPQADFLPIRRCGTGSRILLAEGMTGVAASA